MRGRKTKGSQIEIASCRWKKGDWFYVKGKLGQYSEQNHRFFLVGLYNGRSVREL